jgi:probable HAF family extracellular repeat protein
MKTYKQWLVALAVLGAAAAWIATQPVNAGNAPNVRSRYQVTDLGTLRGHADVYLWQNTLNNSGHVAAYANNNANPEVFDNDVSFLWNGPGDMDLLPGIPDLPNTTALGLNDQDQAVGICGLDEDGNNHAVLWERGRVHMLSESPSAAFAINNAGIVVGEVWNADEEILNAAYWSRGRLFRLPPLEDAPISEAYAINDRGQIVGLSGPDWDYAHAVLWRMSPKPSVVDLGTLGGNGSWATGINNRGDIVGQAQKANGDWRCALWDERGITDLGNFDDAPMCSALSVNNRGQIVGFSGASFDDLTTAHALLWENGHMINLQNLMPANSGWVLQQALSINDEGQIAGIGLHKGKIRVFVLTPTDGPGR